MEREKLIRLVTAVQRGNEAAAGDLYDAFYDGIYYFILKSVDNDPELAADLWQCYEKPGAKRLFDMEWDRKYTHGLPVEREGWSEDI